MENNEKVSFSKYSQKMDEYIKSRNFVINVIPTEFTPLVEKRCKPKSILTAREYINYLNSEIEFWKKTDEKNKLGEFSKVKNLENARDYFYNAVEAYENSNEQNGKHHLNQSLNAISGGALYSKTALAKHLLSNVDRDSYFLRGFKFGIKNNRTETFQTQMTVQDYEGLLDAFAFLKIRDDIKIPEKVNKALTEQMETANNNFANLNDEYTKSFHEQEERINSFSIEVNEEVRRLQEETATYFDERNKRCDELEELYREKLKLEEPAKYWETLEKKYFKHGNIWICIALAWCCILMLVLYGLLHALPTIFTEDAHWLDVFKNSAIITVIASIGAYALRIVVKLALSAYHLSRDAKERYTLSYFYLALKANSSVSDNERAIILNSLFSRADTGLLKGDSAPVMSGDIVSLLNKLDTK